MNSNKPELFRFMSIIKTMCLILMGIQLINHNVKANILQKPSLQKGVFNIRINTDASIDSVIALIQKSGITGCKNARFQSFLPDGFKSNVNASLYSTSLPGNAMQKLLRTYTIHVASSVNIERLCLLIKKQIPEIEIVEPRFSESTLIKPNDVYVNLQSYLPVVKAFEAWDIFSGDTSVVIGIVDNGFLQNHSDLKANISINVQELENNGIDDDNNGFTDDYRGVNLAYPNDGTPAGSTYISSDGHGSLVAGVAAAMWNNDTGIAGAAGKCRFFPIKAGKEGSERVEYGYEGILYAIMRGFPVVNCSWGSPNSYSEINQSIIDLAIERNVLIVAGAGNDGNKAPFYPASYKGVMSVGETEISDIKTNGSSYSWSTDVMAPGYNVYTTDNSEYSFTSASGTSFAAPIVAGLAALVKGKYPAAPMHIIAEHIKATADDITLANPFNAKYIPGRVNFLKALESSPLEKTFIAIKNWEITGSKRRTIGDTMLLKLEVQNSGLIDASNIAISISSLEEFFNPYYILDSIRYIQTLSSSSRVKDITFRIILKEKTDAEFYIRADIKEGNISHPFALFPIRPVPSITTFSSDNITFSMGDYGSLGFVNSRTIGVTGNESFDGIGFILKSFGSMLYEGGLVAGSVGKVVTAFPSSSGLEPRTRFENSQQGASMVLTDSLNPGGNKIGIAIKQQVFGLLPNVIILRYTLYNINDGPIYNPGLGIFGDWDIGNYGRENRVDRFSEAIPDFLQNRGDAEIAWKNGTFNGLPHPYIGMISFASEQEQDFFPQAAGINSSTFGYEDMEFTALLNGGNTIQFGGLSDIAMFSGGRFNRVFIPGDSASFFTLIGADTNRQLLANNLKSAINLLENGTNVKEDCLYNFVSLIIEKDYVGLSAKVPGTMIGSEFSLYSLQGKRLLNGLISDDTFIIPTNELANGAYILYLNGFQFMGIPIVINR